MTSGHDRFDEGVDTDVGGSRLPYRLYRPDRDLDGNHPLVLYLHGAGERGTDNRKHIEVHLGKEGAVGGAFACEPVQTDHPHFFLAPQCPNGTSWRGTVAEAAVALVRKLMQELPVDPDRIYVTGISMGGYGTFYVAESHPTLFAAAVPQSGGGEPRSAARITQLPLWVFHGALDDVVPVTASRVMVEAIRAAGGTPRYTEYPTLGHDIWDTAYSEPALLDWLFTQRRGRPDTAPR